MCSGPSVISLTTAGRHIEVSLAIVYVVFLFLVVQMGFTHAVFPQKELLYTGKDLWVGGNSWVQALSMPYLTAIPFCNIFLIKNTCHNYIWGVFLFRFICLFFSCGGNLAKAQHEHT